MSSTPQNAVNQMLTIFHTAWNAFSYGSTPNYNAFYEGVDQLGDMSTSEEPWARVRVRHVSGGQKTLSNGPGGAWEDIGFLIFEIYMPKGSGYNYTLLRAIRNAYQTASTTGGVWFRNPRINEVGLDGEFVKANIFVDFEYEEVI